MKFCGIDLAVKRASSVGVLEGNIVCVKELISDEEIIRECNDAVVISIDSPMSFSVGHRNVDKEMIRRGYRVLPPSWMKALVERAIKLKNELKGEVIETHPTSSLKNLGLDWKSVDKKKDTVDAIVCALVSAYYYFKRAIKISANDGEIYLLPKEKIEIVRLENNCFKIYSQVLQQAFLS